MTSRWGAYVFVVVLLWACGGKKEGAAGAGGLPPEIPAGYPMPKGGALGDTMKLGDRTSFVFNYKDADAAGLHAELKRELAKAGWPITYDEVQGNRYFVSTEKDGTIVDATVMTITGPQITVVVGPKNPPPPPPEPAKIDDPPAKTDDTSALVAHIDGFPRPPGAVPDAQFPAEIEGRPARAVIVKDKSPMATMAWMSDTAADKGWTCERDQSEPVRMVCKREGLAEQLGVTFREHPAGGSVAFLFIEPPGHQAPPAP